MRLCRSITDQTQRSESVKENSTQNGVQSSPGDRDTRSGLMGDEVSADWRALEPVLGTLDIGA